MDIISIAMLALGLVGILFGFLYGKKRGLTKAIVRLVLIVLAVAGAFVLRESVTETVLNTPIEEGKSIVDLITEGIASGEDAASMQGLVDVIKNILTMVLQVFVFVLIFIILRIATLIVYWIAAGIVNSIRKGKIKRELNVNPESFDGNHKLSRSQVKLLNYVKEDRELLSNKSELNKREITKAERRLKKNQKKLVKKTAKRDRKPWWGSLVGLVQGTVVAIVIMAPVSGLVASVGGLVKSLTSLEIQGEPMLDAETKQMLDDTGLLEYPESDVAKIYDATGGWLYQSISKVEKADGTTTDIKTQIEAINGGVQMAGAVTKLTEINMDEGFTTDVRDSLVDIFNELDEIKDGMSQEGVQELDALMKEALGPLLSEAGDDLPINLDEISFAEVDFSTEGQVISSFYTLYEQSENGNLDEDQVMEDVVTTLSESTLILPILNQVFGDLPEEDRPNLDEEEKAEIEEIINNLENQENAEELRKLFGIK